MLLNVRSLTRNLAKNGWKLYNRNASLNSRHMTKLTSPQEEFVSALYNGIISNRRAELARSITLVETSNPEKKVMAQYLLNKLLLKLKDNRMHKSKVCLRIGEHF